MIYRDIIQQVTDVYQELDQHLSTLANQHGLSCPSFCGRCCHKPDIEASPIEYLPLAAYLYETGQVDQFLARLEQTDNGICVNFNPHAFVLKEWGCRSYQHRGLICRLFGYGYRVNREGIPGLVTCRIMKENIPASIEKANQYAISSPEEVPLFRNYYMKLYAIDPELATTQLPINKAIRYAIEKLFYYYQEHEVEVNEKDMMEV